MLLLVAAAAGWIYQRISDRRDLVRTPPPGQLVDIGTHRLHIWCTGVGSPAVILDSGLGGTSFGWGYVQPEVAKFTQVCSYDRAGQGYSDAGPSPRTTAQIVKEVAELLRRRSIVSVIAVGASIGGLNMRFLASQYPDRVAGLVLVDASHENQGFQMPPYASLIPIAGQVGIMRLLGASLGGDPQLEAPAVRDFERATAFRTVRYQSMYEEATHIPESATQVRSTRRELSIPVTVVTAGRGTNEQWRTFQRDQTSLSKRSCQTVAERSGHVIAIRQPEIVAKAIRATFEAARSGSTPNCG